MLTFKYMPFIFILCLPYASATPHVAANQPLCPPSLAEQFKQAGYLEIHDEHRGAATFDALYAYFDEFITFIVANPMWAQKLYCAKERFIRSKDRNYYSSDFFGFYDESQRAGRNQICFYYATHLHEFICSHYPEFNKVAQIMRFFECCRQIQDAYGNLFAQAATELDVKTIFSAHHDKAPILFKVVKYLPPYTPTRPHYDGSAFSLFLDSTDNESLLLAPYKSSLTVDDFSCALRKFTRSNNQNSIILIPGTLLTEFSIYPTPHLVTQSGNTRYATIAFAMRPNHTPKKSEFTALPNFNFSKQHDVKI